MTGSFIAKSPSSGAETNGIDERGEARIATSSHTAALCRDGRRRLVRLINLSRTGAMIGNCAPMSVGTQVTLQIIDHGEIDAEVRWAEDGRAGLHFARPLE